MRIWFFSNPCHNQIRTSEPRLQMGMWNCLTCLFSSQANHTVAKAADTFDTVSTGIVIWDLENCGVPARYLEQLPELVKATRAAFHASRVVTAVATPPADAGVLAQLRELSYCDVEVLSFLRPEKSNSSASKHSSADYMLKRVRLLQTVDIQPLQFAIMNTYSCVLWQALQRFLLVSPAGSSVTLITSDADFVSEVHHVKVLFLPC